MIDSFLQIGLLHFLAVTGVMFLIGLAGIIISRNLLRIIMSMLLVTMSIVINFAAFGAFCDKTFLNANMICLFLIIVSAVQIGAALAVFYKIYQSNEYLDIEKIKEN